MKFFQKNRLIKYVFLGALMAAGSFFLGKEGFSLAETGGNTSSSTVNNTHISPSVVEAGGSVKVYLSISNAVAEVVSVGIKVESPTGVNSIQIEKLSGQSQGYWSGTLAIPKGVEAGIWRVNEVIVSYATGEVKDYYPSVTFTVNSSISDLGEGTIENIICGSFDYSGWSACQNGVQTRTAKNFYPAGCQGGIPILSQSCVSSPASSSTNSICLQDSWLCKNWGECIGGFQTRFCESILDCPNITSVSPAIKQACTAITTSTAASTTVNYCQYGFSEYGACENGNQSRKIISRLPDGCIDRTIEPLVRSCTTSEVLKTCYYNYSAWSDCLGGKRTRSVASVSLNCLPGNPVLEEKCETLGNCVESDWKCGEWSSCVSTTKQYRNCSLASNCVIISETKPQMSRECLASANTSNSQRNTSSSESGGQASQGDQSQAANETQDQLCARLGWEDANGCDLYSQQSKIIKECLSNNFKKQDECRQYFLEKYGKPSKCQGMSEENCISLINDLILSDLKDEIDPKTRQALVDYSGRTAVVDPVNKVLIIDPKKADDNSTSSKGGEAGGKEVKVEGFSLAASDSKASFILSPIIVTAQQQILSPVAIVFDSNKNGIPDDTEKRMSIVPSDVKLIGQKELSSLSGVDQALINGKPLEQPKLRDDLKESKSLAVNFVETVQADNIGAGGILRLQGKAEPNQVVTLFIYSVMPIVLTAKADAYGNWIYDLDKSLVDGKHEVYAAVNNSEGRIIEASLPTPFFIQEAKAVTVGDFIGIQEPAAAPDASNDMINIYLIGGGIFIFLLIAGFLFIRKKLV
ncbi:MAG: hypothetical protein WCX77_00490 [Candidatus Paceibacterota bacterium]|jgi:hypothetical protein